MRVYNIYTESGTGKTLYASRAPIQAMPTIKVREWTKEELDDIKEEEEHSSYDSVLKSLIKEYKTQNE